MKKILSIATALLLVVGLTACGGSKKAVDCKTTVIQVTDSSGVYDKAYNELTFDGLVQFEKELKDKGACNAKPIQSATESDYVPNISAVSGKKNDLVVAAGFSFEPALKQVAKKFPKQQYLIIDVELKEPNVTSAVFAAHEGSFLVGVAAAEKAKAAGKDTVGFIGGMNSPIILEFKNGFEQGVKAIDPNMKIKVQYTGDFVDTTKAKTIAQQMYNDGAYIIYHAAGNAGNGVINAAKELVKDQGKDVWVIGVDRDQFENGIYDGDKSVVLTSMLKKANTASFEVSKSILDGTFKPGQTLTFDLKNNGIGLPEKNPNLTDEIMKVVESYKEKIIKGEIKVTR